MSIKKIKFYLDLFATNFLAGGIYPFNINERLITVTELNAIASPAYSGLKVIPKG